jgi:uncharacterized FAD-dependent dehydrogenase
MSTRKRKTDELTAEALQAMLYGFSKHLAASLIAKQVKALTGEDVSERTIARRKSEWEAEQRRLKEKREYMEVLLAAGRAGDYTASEMVNALAVEALMRDPDGFSALNPIDVQRTSIQAEKVRLQRGKLALAQRQQDLDEKRFALLQSREQRAVAALKDDGETLTPEQRVQRIREIYGLSA